MQRTNKKLYTGISILTVIIALLLWRELKSYRSITTEASNEPLVAENSTPITIAPSDQIFGNPGAPLTVIEFGDLGNKKSRLLHEELNAFVKTHPADVRLIYKHAPISKIIFSDGVLAHKAAWCAGKQNKLWAFLDTLISSKNNLRESGLNKTAVASKINLNTWSTCLGSEEVINAIQKDLTEAASLSVGKPPLIFLNNKKLNTKLDVDISELLTSLIEK